jgi:transcription-repair coupling factor (superfamily II helicase)
LADIKLEAAVWQIQTIFIQDQYLGFRFADKRRIEQLVTSLQGKMRVVDQETAFVTLKSPNTDPDRLLALIKAILHQQ